MHSSKIEALVAGHTIYLCKDIGWGQLLNGRLLAAAEEAGYEVVVTADADMRKEQTFHGRKIAVIGFSKNNWRLIRPHAGECLYHINNARAGTFTLIEV